MKKIGIGSVAFILVVISILWNTSIQPLGDFCLGDIILNRMGVKAWSNGTSGIHYTVFYSLIFLIPAIAISFKFPKDLFAQIGKIASVILSFIIVVASFFIIL